MRRKTWTKRRRHHWFVESIGGLLVEVLKALFFYAISWIIILGGLVVMNIPQFQAGRTDFVSPDTIFQGIGLTIILFGLQVMLKKSIGLDLDNSAKKREKLLLEEINRLKEGQKMILARIAGVRKDL